MRLLAIQNLNSISAEKKWPPLKSILLGREYYIRHWVISGYNDLLTRSANISDEEAIAVGLLESLRIMRIRESPSDTSCVDAEFRNVFKDELASIDSLNEAFKTLTGASDEQMKQQSNGEFWSNSQLNKNVIFMGRDVLNELDEPLAGQATSLQRLGGTDSTITIIYFVQDFVVIQQWN